MAGSNQFGVAFKSEARALAQAYNSPDLVNPNGRGVIVVIDATVIAATPSVVVKVQGKDPVSGKYFDLLTAAAVTGVSTVVLRIYPGLTAAAGLVVSDILPAVWRVVATHGDADSITYSVGYQLIN